ncbi:hypothetical protein DNTS_018893, partial [Danionella cerebrum]
LPLGGTAGRIRRPPSRLHRSVSLTTGRSRLNLSEHVARDATTDQTEVLCRLRESVLRLQKDVMEM